MKVKNNRELNQCYLRALSQKKYSHFSRTNLDNILFTFHTDCFVSGPLARHSSVDYSCYKTNTDLNIKERNWKETWVAWKGRGPGLHHLHIFKKYFFLHNLLGVDQTVRGTWSVQDPEMVKLGFSPGLCWCLLGMGSAWVMTLRELNTRSGVLVILTRGKSHEGEE